MGETNDRTLRPGPRTTALLIVLVYLLVGLLWILFSDTLLETSVAGDAAALTKLQTYKGWFYILVTAGGLYLLMSFGLTLVGRSESGRLESEERFRAQYKGIPIPTYTWRKADDDFVLIDYNDAADAITGGTIRRALGSPASLMYRERPDILESVRRCYESKGVVKDEVPYRFPHEEKVRTFNVNYVFVPHDLVMVHTEDITARKQAEEGLLRIRQAVESTREAVGIVDRARRVIYYNRAAVELFGYTPDEINAAGGPPIFHADLRTADEVWAAVREFGSWSGQIEAVTKRGEKIPVLLSANVITDGRGEAQGFVATWSDLREQLRMERQLRQSQKMEAVGVLAGGVAHDFNNMLAVILMSCELGLGRLKPAHPARGYFEEIRKAGGRAAELTRQLLAFSRRQILQPKVIDLNAVVNDTGRMLRRLIGEDVRLVLKLDPRLGLVKADPGQIEQVLVNLAVNARDAMPGGGRITVETANVELDEADARRHSPARPGSYVMFSVADTGAGMDEETRARVFEPFFTTKEVGKGTGLGLATVYGIVQQSGGYVWVYSEPGRGTTCKVYLPRVADSPPAAGSEQEAEAPRGSETILLVEDEGQVRALAGEILRTRGYRVLTAADAGEALQICEQGGHEIDLVLADVVMPGMSGRQLAVRLRERRPGLRVLYMSGYTNDAVVQRGVTEEEVAFIQKPFSPRGLAEKVREVLDA